MRISAFFLFVVLSATLIPGPPIAAAWAAGNDSGARAAAQGDLIPLERVFAMLRQSYSGDKLDARIRQGANTTYYEVHWLTAEGRKLIFLVNAYTGDIEETRGMDAGGGR